jgi:hypothetical protein
MWHACGGVAASVAARLGEETERRRSNGVKTEAAASEGW